MMGPKMGWKDSLEENPRVRKASWASKGIFHRDKMIQTGESVLRTAVRTRNR